MPALTTTTVVEAASSCDLVFLEDVRLDLGIDPADTGKDDFLARAISQASQMIASYCNRVLVAEKVRDVIYPARDTYPYQVPGGANPLRLSRWPVISVTSVTIADPPGVTTTLQSGTDFAVDAAAGHLIRLAQHTGYPTIWAPVVTTVTYTAGFETIPADLQQAASRMVVARFHGRGRDPTLRSRSQPGIGDETYWVGSMPGTSGPFPDDVLAILDSYRAPVTV